MEHEDEHTGADALTTEQREAIDALLRERPRWVAFVTRRVPSDVDADDVVQRALARALRHGARLREPARATAWFFRILRRSIGDALEQRGRTLDRVADAPLDEQDLVDEVASQAESDGACRCAPALLETLKPEYAALLRTVVLDETTLRDAAGVLSISENNAAVRLHRARGALREKLERCCGVRSLRACLACTCETEGTCRRES